MIVISKNKVFLRGITYLDQAPFINHGDFKDNIKYNSLLNFFPYQALKVKTFIK